MKPWPTLIPATWAAASVTHRQPDDSSDEQLTEPGARVRWFSGSLYEAPRGLARQKVLVYRRLLGGADEVAPEHLSVLGGDHGAPAADSSSKKRLLRYETIALGTDPSSLTGGGWVVGSWTPFVASVAFLVVVGWRLRRSRMRRDLVALVLLGAALVGFGSRQLVIPWSNTSDAGGIALGILRGGPPLAELLAWSLLAIPSDRAPRPHAFGLVCSLVAYVRIGWIVAWAPAFDAHPFEGGILWLLGELATVGLLFAGLGEGTGARRVRTGRLLLPLSLTALVPVAPDLAPAVGIEPTWALLTAALVAWVVWAVWLRGGNQTAWDYATVALFCSASLVGLAIWTILRSVTWPLTPTAAHDLDLAASSWPRLLLESVSVVALGAAVHGWLDTLSVPGRLPIVCLAVGGALTFTVAWSHGLREPFHWAWLSMAFGVVIAMRRSHSEMEEPHADA